MGAELLLSQTIAIMFTLMLLGVMLDDRKRFAMFVLDIIYSIIVIDIAIGYFC